MRENFPLIDFILSCEQKKDVIEVVSTQGAHEAEAAAAAATAVPKQEEGEAEEKPKKATKVGDGEGGDGRMMRRGGASLQQGDGKHMSLNDGWLSPLYVALALLTLILLIYFFIKRKPEANKSS